MTEGLKRIETTLPAETYGLVKEAATLSGMTVKNFVAKATVTHALDFLERYRVLRNENRLREFDGGGHCRHKPTLPELVEKAEQ